MQPPANTLPAAPDQESRLGPSRGIARGLLGWLVMCAGIGIAITLSRFAEELFAMPAAVAAVIQALLVAALVVPAIALLRRRVDHRSLDGLGLSKRFGLPVSIGVGVALLAALIVWLPAFAAGWVRFDSFRAEELLLFLMVNTVVLFLYEALPEELALRGYAWTNVKDAWSPWVATLGVTLLFACSSTLIGVFQSGTALLFGVEAQGISIAPPGNDPIVYFLQLIVFGLALCAARRIPVAGALAIAIAFHVAQLTVTRVLLGGTGWLSAGTETRFVEPDAIALILVHIVVSGLLFWGLRVWLTRRGTAHNKQVVP